jgi:hypothetical protein
MIPLAFFWILAAFIGYTFCWLKQQKDGSTKNRKPWRGLLNSISAPFTLKSSQWKAISPARLDKPSEKEPYGNQPRWR